MVQKTCDICLEPIQEDQHNYQSTDYAVVCESCCRKLIDRAKKSLVKVISDDELKAFYAESGGSD